MKAEKEADLEEVRKSANTTGEFEKNKIGSMLRVCVVTRKRYLGPTFANVTVLAFYNIANNALF